MDNQITKKNELAKLYPSAVNIGTEEVTQEDINTPVLKIVQPNTQNIDNKKDGSFYRTDTQKQLDTVDVNLIYVTSAEVDNFNKTGKEKVKIYFGVYAGTEQPFKMYVRGWGLQAHRTFQTEVFSLKNMYQIPMLALKVTLSTEKQTGVIQDTGKPYTTYKPVFSIQNNEDESPIIEKDEARIIFLVEAANKFKNIATTSSVHDEEQSEIPAKEEQEAVNPEDIPF